MSLLDDLNAVKPRKLSLSEWLISRTPEERARFEALCADLGGVSTESLVGIVRKHGGATTDKTLNEFRARVATR